MKLTLLRLEHFCSQEGIDFKDGRPYHCGKEMEIKEEPMRVMRCRNCRMLVVDKNLVNGLNGNSDEGQPTWVRIG